IHESTNQTPKPIRTEERKTADAMFMGLGDVIFPGILVISAMTWLPDEVGFAGLHGPTAVAFGTLIGGLAGYIVLMTQVARGKPQAGLPLLNGGSILGYLISTIIVLGFDALAFNITLF
ncbi:MAG: presenilin family intramembrane aspartyl protease, partial [Candidatus Thermoplasmatota archaeon]|nr:presenilin family intramembrane aspartyl protease [Candidatus Thermoplasmatota archaeon]